MRSVVEAELRLGGDAGYRLLQRMHNRPPKRWVVVHLLRRGSQVGEVVSTLCADISVTETGMERPMFDLPNNEVVMYCTLCVSLAGLYRRDEEFQKT